MQGRVYKGKQQEMWLKEAGRGSVPDPVLSAYVPKFISTSPAKYLEPLQPHPSSSPSPGLLHPQCLLLECMHSPPLGLDTT